MRLAAIMMQKNEIGILSHWVRYYTELCQGLQHLYIFDDNSNLPEVIAQLKEAEAQGAHVYWNSHLKWKLESKGKLVARLMVDLHHDYDWFLPVDCDEFVCLDDGHAPLVDRDAIIDEIERAASGGKSILRIDRAFVNAPHSTNVFRGKAMKVVVKSTGELLPLDGGLHLYDYWEKTDLVAEDRIAKCQLAHLHFHNRPYAMAIRSSREKLKNRIKDFRKETLESYNGGGYHLKWHFLITEDQYLKWFVRDDLIDVGHIFSKLSLAVPYSGPREPVTQQELDVLLDPVNPAYLGT